MEHIVKVTVMVDDVLEYEHQRPVDSVTVAREEARRLIEALQPLLAEEE